MPESYVNIPHCDETAAPIKLVGMSLGTIQNSIPHISPNSFSLEQEWLDHVSGVQEGMNTTEMPITYSGYMSTKQLSGDLRPKAVVGVFPVLDEKASSLATVKHIMLQSQKVTDFCNPHQTAVLVGDLPLYAQMKRLQVIYPTEFGEHKIVPFL